MSNVSADLVKQLRQMTGAGMMDCKAALAESAGDMTKAVEVLRKKGLKDMGKRAVKTAAEGTIGVYVHGGGQIVSIVELNCETDFVARSEEFTALARDIAMQVAAARPMYISAETIPADVITKEEEIARAQLDPKQAAVADKIIQGRIAKFREEAVLLEQQFIKDDSGKLKIKDLIEALAVKIREKIQVRRFERFEVGEGIVKQESNFADEVAAMAQGN